MTKTIIDHGNGITEEHNGDEIRWKKDGKTHRDDGPAIIYDCGTKLWYKKGKKHRLDGPSVEYSQGEKHWHRNGKLHRLDGPAVECPNGDNGYWINDQEISEQEFNALRLTKELPIKNGSSPIKKIKV